MEPESKTASTRTQTAKTQRQSGQAADAQKNNGPTEKRGPDPKR
jgi:hypothetical protein